MFFIGDKKHPPAKFLHRKSQYFKLWCKANNFPKKYSIYRKSFQSSLAKQLISGGFTLIKKSIIDQSSIYINRRELIIIRPLKF